MLTQAGDTNQRAFGLFFASTGNGERSRFFVGTDNFVRLLSIRRHFVPYLVITWYKTKGG